MLSYMKVADIPLRSIVKVIPNESKKSYYIVKVSDNTDKMLTGTYRTFCLGEWVETKINGYPVPDGLGAFTEQNNSFEIIKTF